MSERTGAIIESYKAILQKLRVSRAVSEACLAQTAELAAHPLDTRGTEDLRDRPFVTIDNDDSRDLDQALFIEATATGFLVWYALADAAFFIRPGSPLYEHALRQGTSHYFPGWSVPMLPAELSEGVISLNPHVDRRAVVFRVALDTNGVVTAVSIKRAMIHSQAKLSYDGVQAWLDGKHHDHDNAPYAQSLRHLQTVGLLRMELAREREAIMFERYEPEVRLNDAADRFEVARRIRNDVERYNEQISLLCNTEGARLMAELGHSPQLQSVFRVHLPPLSQRLAELQEVLDDIVKTHELGPQWQWKGQSLADYLAQLPAGDEHARLRIAIERQVRYANRSSDFSATVGPHFALGVDHYARFTAPMREIVGIFTHKEALEVLGMQPASPRKTTNSFGTG
ncbi:MAG: RNB domain-containing ribonuclease [bacterium]